MINTLGVIGAGTMGAGIAHVAALHGCEVLLHEVSADALHKAMERIQMNMKKSIQRGKFSQEKFAEVIARIHPGTNLENFSHAEFVIEAVFEDLSLKRKIITRLDAICADTTVFASNTSSLSITSLSTASVHPHRVVGMHFFNPAQVMKLIEVVWGQLTKIETAQQTMEFARQIGKTPVLVKNSPGFIVNRVARPFYGEALRLLGEGVATVDEIDRIVRLEGGFKMGPFELMDLIGIDVNLTVTQSVYDQFFQEPRFRPHPIQQTMVETGMLGRKTGKGFYEYIKK